ncbi:hypothetical protein [Jatrophihabitans sp.]|uniref:hypothetical protein n=1 Tax=Jatrophihabitans sp. TaxID=1932789 RepID=UPI0030C76AF1
MWTEEQYDDDEPAGPLPYVDGAWGRTANPNTVDGELQNLAAFGNGLARLSGPRRTGAKLVVWLILISTALTVIYGIIGIFQS